MTETKKVFSLDDVEEDNLTDEIGVLINAVQKIPTHTKHKKKLIGELQKVCQSTGYINFQGSTPTFHIGKIGQSYLYDVPIKKTGHLLKFRGKRIRVICIASGKLSTRYYMAGEV